MCSYPKPPGPSPAIGSVGLPGWVGAQGGRSNHRSPGRVWGPGAQTGELQLEFVTNSFLLRAERKALVTNRA